MRVLAVITARAGSKEIKHKNLLIVDGKPLLAHSIEACEMCPDITDYIVSTDSPIYARLANKYAHHEVCPFLRPKELAEDVPSEDVIIHALTECEKIYAKHYDAICTIQPTSPFIMPTDIQECVEALTHGYDSAITVCKVHDRPQWMFTVNDDNVMEPLIKADTRGEWGVRQKHQDYYIPNGMCYLTLRNTLLEEKRIIGKKCFPVIVPRLRSIDIDTEEDVRVAKALVDACLIP